MRVQLRNLFPVAVTLRDYRAEWLAGDFVAGLAVAAIALPIGIAYPAIAGLPPEVGLYASIFALVGYALYGSSRQLIVGPDTATCIILGGSLLQLGVATPEQRIVVSAGLAVIVGVLCLPAAFLKLGFIANFLSRPILTGFLCGVSLSLFAGQIGRLSTVHIDAHGFIRPLLELAGKVDQIHGPTLILGAALFVLLRLLHWLAPRAPGPLVALAVATLLSAFLDLESRGIAVVGAIPTALPSFGLTLPSDIPVDDLVLSAFGILVVTFGSGIVTARSFGARSGERVDANRELVGFGVANIASGLFGGFPVTGADSRTAINQAAGGKSQVASLVAAGALTLILLVLTDALRFLPVAALGAVLASASVDLFDVKALRQIWKTSRVEFLLALTTIAGVIAFGVLKGVLIAVGATLLYLIAQASRPRDALLGRIPGRDGFYKLHRRPEAKAIPDMAIYLIQGGLFFFNVDYVRQRVRWIAGRLPRTTRWFVLDAAAIPLMDGTAAATLDEIREEFALLGVRFGLADLHNQPRELLTRAGVLEKVGAEMVFDDLDEALHAFGSSVSSVGPVTGREATG